MTGHPTPRPALRKAPDSDVHPAEPRTSVVPLRTGGTASEPDRSATSRPATPPPRPSFPAAVGPRRRLSEIAPQERDLRRRRGSTTSDALRGTAKDRMVDAGVRIPKSLRKRLRQEAKHRKLSPDELLILILRDYLDS